MKKLTFLFALIILGSATVHAQDGDKNNSFKANPLGLLFGLGKINYERKLNDSMSAQLGLSYFSFSNSGNSFSGLGLVPEVRFYVGGNAIEGFYVAPFMKYNGLTLEDKDSEFKGRLNAYRGGAKAGMQWLMGKNENFIIDLAFGGKYSDFNIKVKEGSSDNFDSEDLFEGFSPELHFAIGFAF